MPSLLSADSDGHSTYLSENAFSKYIELNLGNHDPEIKSFINHLQNLSAEDLALGRYVSSYEQILLGPEIVYECKCSLMNSRICFRAAICQKFIHSYTMTLPAGPCGDLPAIELGGTVQPDYGFEDTVMPRPLHYMPACTWPKSTI